MSDGEVWPERDLETVDRCPACGASGRRTVHRELEDRVVGTAPGRWCLHRCQECESMYLDPRPTPGSIGRAYRSYYTHAPRSPSLPVPGEARAGPIRRISTRVRSLSRRPGQRLPVGAPRGARVLDVGCGSGEFLITAARLGWTGVGVDFDPHAVAAARARGLTVHLGDLNDLPQDECAFDYISLNHVLEHVHRPAALVRQCADLLAPDGILWIETPNAGALGHRRYGRFWRGLEPPRHLCIASLTALEGMLDDAGLRVREHRNRRFVSINTYAKSESVRSGRPFRPPGFRDVFRPRAVLDGIRQGRSVDEREFLSVHACRRR